MYRLSQSLSHLKHVSCQTFQFCIVDVSFYYNTHFFLYKIKGKKVKYFHFRHSSLAFSSFCYIWNYIIMCNVYITCEVRKVWNISENWVNLSHSVASSFRSAKQRMPNGTYTIFKRSDSESRIGGNKSNATGLLGVFFVNFPFILCLFRELSFIKPFQSFRILYCV